MVPYGNDFYNFGLSLDDGSPRKRGRRDMSGNNKIRAGLEIFYGTIMENYKNSQRAVMAESKVSAIFKKANYDERIKDFGRVIKALNMLRLTENEDSSLLEKSLLKSLDLAKFRLQDLCQSQIKLQETLKVKAQRIKKVSIKEYTEIMSQVRTDHDSMQKALHQLDLVYVDWMEENDYRAD